MTQTNGNSLLGDDEVDLDQRVANLIADPARLLELCDLSVQAARRWYQCCGQPMVCWRDGKIVQLPPQNETISPETDTK